MPGLLERATGLQRQAVSPVLGFEFPVPADFAVGGSLHQMDVGLKLDAAEQPRQPLVEGGSSQAIQYVAPGGPEQRNCVSARAQVIEAKMCSFVS